MTVEDACALMSATIQILRAGGIEVYGDEDGELNLWEQNNMAFADINCTTGAFAVRHPQPVQPLRPAYSEQQFDELLDPSDPLFAVMTAEPGTRL